MDPAGTELALESYKHVKDERQEFTAEIRSVQEAKRRKMSNLAKEFCY